MTAIFRAGTPSNRSRSAAARQLATTRCAKAYPIRCAMSSCAARPGFTSRRFAIRTGTPANAAAGCPKMFDGRSAVCSTASRRSRHQRANARARLKVSAPRRLRTLKSVTGAASRTRSSQAPSARKQPTCTCHRAGSRRRTSSLIWRSVPPGAKLLNKIPIGMGREVVTRLISAIRVPRRSAGRHTRGASARKPRAATAGACDRVHRTGAPRRGA